MRKINIHEAKTHLSRLVEEAAKGDFFVIAKAGKPIAQVTAIETASPQKRSRLGFMKGQIKVPDDFDRMMEHEIAEMFGVDK